MDASPADERDTALFLKMCAGGPMGSAAAAKFVERNQRILYCIALGLLRDNSHDAEEAVQSTYLEGFKYAQQFGSGPGIRKWLIHILYNLCYKKLRGRKRRKEVDAPEGFDPPDPGPGPEAELSQRELRAKVRRDIARLPEKERDVMVLRFGGLEVKEVAETLEVDEEKVRTWIRSARKRLELMWRGDPGLEDAYA